MDFWAVAEKYGLPIAMLLFAVTALYFDVVVSGPRFRQVRRERDMLLRLLTGSARASERVAKVADRSTSLAERAVSALVAHHEGEADDAGLGA